MSSKEESMAGSSVRNPRPPYSQKLPRMLPTGVSALGHKQRTLIPYSITSSASTRRLCGTRDERLGGCQIENEFELGRLLDWDIAWSRFRHKALRLTLRRPVEKSRASAIVQFR